MAGKREHTLFFYLLPARKQTPPMQSCTFSCVLLCTHSLIYAPSHSLQQSMCYKRVWECGEGGQVKLKLKRKNVNNNIMIFLPRLKNVSSFRVRFAKSCPRTEAISRCPSMRGHAFFDCNCYWTHANLNFKLDKLLSILKDLAVFS